ncbi:stage III sporulation protein AF [Clostridium polyendosporum]|uniref:Stage III sporulation protein AF n=1 Tax=Clostridium polyendosporum TaxID=69208 RepID=A0A919RWV5_9CLOT|nr:stage III sporulation protein AF [Clostridium polyendosporum]GIM27950.1 stage III sporulation protein AF [Clostridium polyendosporum]
MEFLKSWVLTLSATLIFITAVELILPDNSLKKYVKFVLGLILMAVILNPIIKLLTSSDIEISTAIDKYQNTTNMNISEKNDNNKTEEKFFDNLQKNCEKILEDKLKNNKFKVEIDGKFDFENMTLDVNYLNVYIITSGIKKIEKVVINKNNSEKKEVNNNLSRDIKTILSQELKTSEDKIKVFEME